MRVRALAAVTVVVCAVVIFPMTACSGSDGTAPASQGDAGTGGGTGSSGGAGAGGAGGAQSGSGGLGSSDADGAVPLGVADDISLLVAAQCQLARTCCDRAGYSLEPLTDCETEFVRQSDLLMAAASGTAIIDDARLSACADAIATLTDTCTYAETLSECQLTFTGTRAEGEPCDDVVECIRGEDPVVCLRIGQGTVEPITGVCHSMTRGVLGMACLQSIGETPFYGATYTTFEPDPSLVYCDAADGLYCSSLDDTCVALGTEGEACSGGDCAPGLYCDSTCRPTKSEGATCVNSSECSSPLGCIAGICAQWPVASDKVCSGDYN